MGLRDLLKRRILGRKDNDDEEDETESKNGATSTSSNTIGQATMDFASKLEVADANDLHAQEDSQQKPAKPERRVVRMAEDPATGEVNVQKRFGVETVQEKINRVKAGKMTDEEKEAFLRTALSAGDTPLSRPPLIQKKGAAKDDLDAAQRMRGKASPFPTDTIIRKSFSLGRGNNMTTSRDLSAFDSSLDTQKKKREYLDMVTNPDRFRTYKAVPSSATDSSKSSTPASDPFSDRFDNGNYFPGSSMSSSRNNPQAESSSSFSPPPVVPPMPADLGARLGAHAMASEKIAADLRRQAEEDRREKERLLEEERREQERRNQEALRLREAELLRREREVAERKKAQEEAVRKADEERKRKEEERLREMMQAQEAYWAKKLQAERSARAQKNPSATARTEADASTESINDERNIPLENLATTASELTEEQTSDSQLSSTPLNDVSNKKVESQAWGWPQRTAADILGRNPRKAAASSSNALSDFQAEQARKKAEIERTKALQLERLKALNSPIPNRPATRGMTPSTGAFQPQYPPSSTGSRGLGGLSRTVQSPPPQPPVKDDSLEDMFPPTPSTPKVNSAVKQQPATTISKNTVTTAKPDKPISPWSGLGNIGSKPKKSDPDIPTKSESNNNVAKSKTPVIRQQLPLNNFQDDEDDEEDEENGIGRDSRGLSIAEVMQRVKKEAGDPSKQQERSKKWGVDMSRFRE